MSLAIPQWMKSLFAPVQQCPHQGAINLAYRPDIDGLRALAVLCVVAFHAFPHTLRGGFIGVDIFFVISGYLISSIIVQDLEKGQFSIATFYNRRIRRIFPALILVMLSVMAFGWFALLPDEYKALGKHVFGGSAFISNFILWRESGYFDVASQLKPLLHLWSLGIEEQFYIFFPLILWLCAKYRFRIPTIVAMLCVLSFLDNMYLFRKAPVVDFYSPLSRVWELMAGAVLSTALRHQAIQQGYLRVDAVCARWIREGETPNDGRSLSLVLAVCGVLLVAAGLLLSRQGDAYPGWKALLPVSGAVCLLAAGPANGISKYLLANRLAVFIGLISYPLYLWHWPLLSYAHIIIGDMDSSTRLLRVGLVVGAVVLATLTYFLVERPVRFKQKNTRIVKFLILGMVIMCLVGGAVHLLDGVDTRKNMAQYAEVSKQLASFQIHDDAAYKYDKAIPNDPNTHTGFSNANSDITTAVYGDSHALSGFWGIAEINKANGINTLLVSRDSSRMAITGLLLGTDNEKRKKAETILDIICAHKDIKKVFIFCRAQWVYDEYIRSNADFRDLAQHYSKDEIFEKSMRIAVDKLHRYGKKVYIVIDNPRLPHHIKYYIPRPFKQGQNLGITRSDVVSNQKAYRESLQRIQNATIIETIDAFCPAEKCKAFSSGGIPLYKDDDHLSFLGSEMLAKDVLKPYLMEIQP